MDFQDFRAFVSFLRLLCSFLHFMYRYIKKKDAVMQENNDPTNPVKWLKHRVAGMQISIPLLSLASLSQFALAFALSLRGRDNLPEIIMGCFLASMAVVAPALQYWIWRRGHYVGQPPLIGPF